jgi:hypothetical protein
MGGKLDKRSLNRLETEHADRLILNTPVTYHEKNWGREEQEPSLLV